MCDTTGRSCPEIALFCFAICTVVWGSFALLYSSLLVFVGFAWTQGDVRSANLTVPLVLSSLFVIAAGSLSLKGSGIACRSDSYVSRRNALIGALGCRFVPFVLILYVVIFVATVQNSDSYNWPPSPPSPPTFPFGLTYPHGPPSAPSPPAFPPLPPFEPPGSHGISGFFTVAGWLTFAALVIAPIFEIVVLCNMQSQSSSKQMADGGIEG